MEDLVPWVAKLKGSLTEVNTEGSREEVQRRTQLEKFVSAFFTILPYWADPLQDLG